MSALAPCPFCGGAARIESNRDWHKLFANHDEDCVFDADDHDLMYPAQPGYLIEIAQVWNRRAPLPAEQPSNPVQDAETLRRAIETVCEGWTLPFDARKVLETALWSNPVARIVGQQTKGGGNAE